ncbi:prolyl oligopeptidase family serine peptidase [Candidatus Bathyarchaeota archaeon]|nr:prolyl oligopeptidase family serine peptidase [Candidatus Bathyarchaeota archaeon]
MKEWRKRTFPVGIKEESLNGELADYPLIVYYPALNEGQNSLPNEKLAPYPGIVFAPGYLATAKDYEYIGKILGSHGYVAAFFSADVKADPTKFRELLHKFFEEKIEFNEGLKISINEYTKGIAQYKEATTKTIDYLCSNPMDIVRTNRIGLVGHSLGGMTVLKAATQDARLKAVVACSAVNIKMIIEKMMSGIFKKIGEKMMDNGEFATRIKIPTQFIYGTEDRITPFEHGLSYYNMIRDTSKEILAINDPKRIIDRLSVKAHLLGLTVQEKIKNEYTPIVMKYMIHWLNFFLYKDRESWTYIFGKKIQNDLNKNILSKLKREA